MAFLLQIIVPKIMKVRLIMEITEKYKLLTLKEAAQYLRMHRGSLYRLLENGKCDIPSIKLGGKWLFNLESLNKYLANKESQPRNQ